MKEPIPAAELNLDALIIEAVNLKKAISIKEGRLTELTDEIKARAAAAPYAHEETKSGGKKWTQGDGRGHSVVVSFPVAKRKWFEVGDLDPIRKLTAQHFSKLFPRTVLYQGVKDLEAKAKELLPKSHAKKLLELATEPPSPSISFELKEGA
jgi:hypothetical protein